MSHSNNKTAGPVSSHYVTNIFTPTTQAYPVQINQSDSYYGTEWPELINGNNIFKKNIYGLGGDDIIAGGMLNDNLYGGTGNDTVLTNNSLKTNLYGDTGNDFLAGYFGNDVLNGGSGADQMFGGKGSDTYYVDHIDDEVNEKIAFTATINGNNVSLKGDLFTPWFNDIDTVYVSVSNYKVPAGFEKVIYTQGATALPYFIDAVYSGQRTGYLAASQNKWKGIGKALKVSYSFAVNSHDAATGETFTGFREYSAAQKANVRKALEAYSKVADITFTEVADGQADFRFYLNDLKEASNNYRIGKNVCPCCKGQHQAFDSSEWITSGYAYFGGDVHLNSNLYGTNNQAFAHGQDGYDTLLHEVGHSLGLKHPGQYGTDDGPFLSTQEEHLGNTLMTYNTNGHTQNQGLKIFDLAAVHYLFGTNKTARSGNNTYTLTDRYIWDGAGNDTLTAANASQNVFINLAPGGWIYTGNKASLLTATGQAFIGFGTYIENAVGSNFNDRISGNSLDNTITGLFGDDLLSGGWGNDQLLGGDGNDTLYGEHGDDRLYGDSGNDKLYGNAGNDLLSGGWGYDQLWGGDGNDTLYGEHNEDMLYGEAGNDKLYGNSGNDKLYGGDSNDVLTGGWGDDHMWGDKGNDVLYGEHNNDRLFGGSGNDRLYGNSGNDLLGGGWGDDRLWGGDGNDTLYGEHNNDVLYGGAGKDILYGGAGKDTFVFDSALGGGNVDIVKDFAVGMDKIALGKAIFGGGLDSSIEAAEFGLGSSATNSRQRILFNQTDGKLYYDVDGNGNSTAVHFATLQGSGLNQLDHTSFSLI
ncbi:matrixin family metalloprotease [Neisseria shayeganii]|uniref:Matrixin family metalloprotease n=1 Tax=Neisseria shayeganii TaxID=607712 RepID=A0A7D7RTR2_9NEIS|nr:matrixin family metalloprotease [Neisseria shayeganii]QMT39444.1 matrixin family metalloprotease [Neisseria shayeganii]